MHRFLCLLYKSLFSSDSVFKYLFPRRVLFMMDFFIFLFIKGGGVGGGGGSFALTTFLFICACMFNVFIGVVSNHHIPHYPGCIKRTGGLTD